MSLCITESSRVHPAQNTHKEEGEGALLRGNVPEGMGEIFLVRMPVTVSKKNLGEWVGARMSCSEKNN